MYDAEYVRAMSHAASNQESSNLDELIAPEVHHDEFFEAIRNLAAAAAIDTVLEIGSSSGEGSTLAWVEGLRLNPRRPKLYCMEVSKVRCEALEQRWGPEGFVECFLGASVELDQFPPAADVERFHREVSGPLQKYPLEQVLGWLKADIDYIKDEGVQTGRIREIKRTRGIENFGAVLIDGSEFTGNTELDEVYGAEFILLDDTQTYKCHAAHHRLLHDPGYELIAENPQLRHGYSIFRRRRRTMLDPLTEEAPVHYFTIVLNGEPFIRHHIEVLRQLPFRWHWHLVEGAATLSHDTARSATSGAELPDERHRSGLSVDGTSDYLDELAAQFPDRVTLYRPPAGKFWDGKIQMVAQPLQHIFEDAVLWEIDADELWTVEQLMAGRQLFLQAPSRATAWFWCRFFVGERLVVSTRNGYSQNPAYEWLRAWRFRPGLRWLAHEPPVLAERLPDGSWHDIAQFRGFFHGETEAAGLVFQHYAYATEEQVAFKERYYGYAGAVAGWRKLQKETLFPTLLNDAFPWVEDKTLVNTAENVGITPLAARDPASGRWKFQSHAAAPSAVSMNRPLIVVDGIFFQFNNTGIGRVWIETLRQWAASGFASQVRLLDRDGTAPKIPGITTRTIPRYNPENPGDDAAMLQRVCDELAAGVFISTYYTSPVRTPSVALIYDMIPELLGDKRESWAWHNKALAILQARHIACISESTARDVLNLHPEIPQERLTVTHLAAPPEFSPASADALASFRQRHNLENNYLIVAGERIGIRLGNQGYKNISLVFRAWSLLPADERSTLAMLCTGGKPELESELRVLAPDADVRLMRLSDDDLRTAYSGAVALVYPSLYEGFGLPVIEAMSCGCPVITCSRASLSEVAGDAAWLVNPWDAKETAAAIRSLRGDPAMRNRHVTAGIAQASRFSFPKTAAKLADILCAAAVAETTAKHPATALLVENIRALQSSETKLNQTLAALHAQIAKLKKKLNLLDKTNAKLELRVQQERDKRRRPFKRFWKHLRGMLRMHDSPKEE